MKNIPIYFDGECPACTKLTHFVEKRDTKSVFRFVSLHSPEATGNEAIIKIQKEHGDTIVVEEKSNHYLIKSDAAVYILKIIGGVWRVTSAILRIIPRPLRDWGYDFIGKHRLRFF